MPQYEFECLHCAHRFTVLVSWSEKDSVRCPQCQCGELKQIWSVFSTSGKSLAGSGCSPAAGTA
ncbi:MAG: zinc ribbon domain-containing protein [Bacillota bacterium]